MFSVVIVFIVNVQFLLFFPFLLHPSRQYPLSSFRHSQWQCRLTAAIEPRLFAVSRLQKRDARRCIVEGGQVLLNMVTVSVCKFSHLLFSLDCVERQERFSMGRTWLQKIAGGIEVSCTITEPPTLLIVINKKVKNHLSLPPRYRYPLEPRRETSEGRCAYGLKTFWSVKRLCQFSKQYSMYKPYYRSGYMKRVSWAAGNIVVVFCLIVLHINACMR